MNHCPLYRYMDRRLIVSWLGLRAPFLPVCRTATHARAKGGLKFWHDLCVCRDRFRLI